MADKMYKNQYKVVVTTKGGYTATFDDSVTAGAGAMANAALMAHEDLRGQAGDDFVFIPGKAVDHAVITFSRTQVDKPADDTCVEA